jgi:biotin carboxyl carrier protein
MLRAAGLRTGPALLFARRLSTCARPSLRARAGGGAARLVANSPFRPAVGRVAAIGAQRRAFSDTVLISVPSMGDSISEGDIGVVNVAAGDVVNADDVLCEIETDKVTSEVTTPVSGTVAEVLVEEGDTVIVNQELFKVTPGEGVAVPKAAAETPAAPSPPASSAPPPPPPPAPASDATASHGRTPMIQFRYGCNKGGATPASGGAVYTGGGILPDFANHVDPAPADVRYNQRRKPLTEEEMEGIMVRTTPPVPDRCLACDSGICSLCLQYPLRSVGGGS